MKQLVINLQPLDGTVVHHRAAPKYCVSGNSGEKDETGLNSESNIYFIPSGEGRISEEKESSSQHSLNSPPNVSFKKRQILC